MPRNNRPSHRRKIREPLSPARRRLVVAGIVLLLIVLAWTMVKIAEPAFHTKIVITSGADGGIYRGFADRYAKILKRAGVTLDVRSSSGSVENYERLTDPGSDVEVGFIQSGTTKPKPDDQIETIAAVSYEPIWVFYRGNTVIDRLSQLHGKRISVGVPGSGLLNVSTVLLGYSGISSANATLLQLDAPQTYEALESGKLDVGFFIGRPDAPMQQKLLTSDLKLMSFAQADALVQKFPSLAKVIFPRASTSIANDLPQKDVTLLAATALLVAKDSLHPALVYLLLEAATEVHGGDDYFTPIGTFPNLKTDEYPISDESTRFFKSGKPFLQRYLPFWLASFIERRLLILLPFMAVLIGLAQAIPRMLAARTTNRLTVWYRDLQLLEDEIRKSGPPTSEQIAQWRDEIDYIEAHASRLQMPKRYLPDIYLLKQAITAVRVRILELAQQSNKQRAG